jgi:hypothetical protein
MQVSQLLKNYKNQFFAKAKQHTNERETDRTQQKQRAVGNIPCSCRCHCRCGCCSLFLLFVVLVHSGLVDRSSGWQLRPRKKGKWHGSPNPEVGNCLPMIAPETCGVCHGLLPCNASHVTRLSPVSHAGGDRTRPCEPITRTGGRNWPSRITRSACHQLTWVGFVRTSVELNQPAKRTHRNINKAGVKETRAQTQSRSICMVNLGDELAW